MTKSEQTEGGAATRERVGFPAGVPCWVDTAQPDPVAAVEFYGGLFGWDFTDRMPPGSPAQYFVASLDGREVAAIGSLPVDRPESPRLAMWTTYVGVDSVDETTAKVRKAGGLVVTEPFDVLDAGRTARCVDPGGASFSLWESRAHHGAQLVNAPGSWNWSNLHTRDLDGAGAFYQAVFGWAAAPVDLGSGETLMWRLPGYVEFLETFEPGPRDRQAEAGVPAGFGDAIGWMLPLPEQPTDADAPAVPHWAVTFAVADTDRVTDRAVELGGTLVVPPVDAGPARLATVRDPQGGVFTVSTYDPER